MEYIGVFTPEQARQLWQWYQTAKQLPAYSNHRPAIEAVDRKYCVILDAALAVATNSKTGATSCLATICDWSGTAYVESNPVRQITVYNHSESTAYAIDTFGFTKTIDGHWWFFGDCAAMAAR